METAAFETDLSLFKYDNLEQLPPAYRDLGADERTERIESALDTLGDDVVILGHNYQRREIVEHADFIGDSYQLSKEAAESDADYVIFGGVTFMAESADIITDDDQSVILPSMEASCPMAGMAEALQVDAAWAELTAALDDDEEIIPITYMNSYADLKAFCAEQGGLVCTSSNAHKAFEYAFEKGDKVLFLPDKHLGENTAHRLGMADETVEWDPGTPRAPTPRRRRKRRHPLGGVLPGPRTLPRAPHRVHPRGLPRRERHRPPRVPPRGRRGRRRGRLDIDYL